MSARRLSARHPAPAALLAALTLAALAPAPAEAQSANRNVVIVLSDEPTGLDACIMDNSYNGRVVKQNIAETLTEIDPDGGALKPRLATAWTQVDDKTWRFKLRDGVKFSDGAPFNAETAAVAIARMMNKEAMTNAAGVKSGLDCSTRTRFFASVDLKAKAVDATTLEIAADQPVPILPTQMGVVPMVSPNTPTDKLTNTPVGTGPYVLDHWTPGQEVVLRRNPNYWGGQPQVEQARYVWRSESSVRASMVKIGEADFAPTIAPQEATDPKLDVSYLNAETTWLKVDTQRAPLDDIRVRRALNYAIDREALRGSVFPRNVVPATQMVMGAVAGHNFEIDKKVWPYDPAKAKALLAEAKAAGVDVGKEIHMVGRINIYPNAQEAMEAMAAMLKAVGFNIRMQMLEVSQWTQINRRPYAEDRGPVISQAMHDNDKGDPVFSVYARYACDGLNSWACDPELDKKIKLAATLSGEARVKQWQDIFRAYYEDYVPDIYMFHMVGFSRVGPRIDFKPSVATNNEIQIAQMKFK